MKRISHLYEKMNDLEFIKLCIKEAAKGKTKRKQVRAVLKDIERHATIIKKMVETHKFDLKPTTNRTIPEYKKKRNITISPFFPNQVLDYMLVRSIKPLCKRLLYTYAVGNVDKKGITYGKNYLQTKVKRYPFFLKLDIHHFYESVKTKLLLEKMEKRIKDKEFLDFVWAIIGRFPNLPIGTYYSQWLSNFYLAELDHTIKQKCGIAVYIRYVDDMVLLDEDEGKLKNAERVIKSELELLRLELKHEGTVRDSRKTPISFLGFRFSQQGVWLRKAIISRLKSTAKKMKEHTCLKLCRRLAAYSGWLKSIVGGYLFYKNEIKDIIKFGYAKRRISNEANQNKAPCTI